MATWRKCGKHYQVITWLLLAPMLAQIVTPVHFHLHHEVSPNQKNHDHVVYPHLLTDSHASESLVHESAHVLPTTPEVITKQHTDNGFVFILFVYFVVLSITILIVSIYLRRNPVNIILHSFYFDLGPPLRAPPSS